MSKPARSYVFDNYLAQLRLTNLRRYREIIRAERVFTENWYYRLVSEQMLLDEQMQGFEETPAGKTTPRYSAEGVGDWSWHPARDKALGENFQTFRGGPQSPAEARPRGAEPGAKFYGIPDHMVNETKEQFEARVL